jgi:drug/metabolite transporter (DMT)-like permease
MSSRARTYLLLAGLALVWGVHWPLAKIALRDLPPFTYGALRVATALGAICAVQAARGQLHLPDRRDWPIVLSVALGQMAGGIVLMNLALPMISAGRSSILVYTMPLWVVVIELTALRGRSTPRQLGGLVVGLVGIGLLINPMAIDWHSDGQVLGSGELILSAMIWGVTTIHIRRHHWHSSSLDLEPWQLLVAGVPLALAAVSIDAGRTVHWNPVSLGIVVYSGLLATAIAFWLSQSISRSLTPLATTMGFLAVPVVGLLSAAVILGEPLALTDLVGFATTFAGILMVSLAPEREAMGAPDLETGRAAEATTEQFLPTTETGGVDR